MAIRANVWIQPAATRIVNGHIEFDNKQGVVRDPWCFRQGRDESGDRLLTLNVINPSSDERNAQLEFYGSEAELLALAEAIKAAVMKARP
jgi:hypothetical protein